MRRTPIHRAPMRARDRDLPLGAGARFGVARGVVGIGETPGEKGARMLHRFAGLEEGAFVWTRTGEDEYRLGRIAGPWRHDDSEAAREVGIHHVRPADWLDRPFTAAEIPEAVAATFARGGRNFQRTHSEAAERRTAELWAEHAGAA
jgi:hypothetical protein